MRLRRALLGFVTAALLLPQAAQAQRRPPRARSETRAGQTPSLKNELGLDGARRLLLSDDRAQRLRAFEKLSVIHSEAALELLGKALDAGGAARDGHERLAAVRALAPHARLPIARAALVRALAAPASLERADPLLALARQTAALALGRSGDPPAQAALAQALRQPGRSAEAALAALSAYPPADLRPVLRARGAVTPALLDLLRALDDPRTRSLLHQIATRGAPELRAQALVSLGKLRDARARELGVETWSRERHPALRLAAAQTLALCGAKEAPAAVAALLQAEDSASVDAAIAIALEAPAPALVPALERALTAADGPRRERLLAALGRAGGPAAARALEKVLGSDSPQAFAAAYALALSAGSEARAALERALGGRPAQRQLAVLAAALRREALRDEPSGLASAARELLGAREAESRAAGAFASALLDSGRGAELMEGTDPVIVRAAARAALAGNFAGAAARRLARETDATTQAALAIALNDDEAADQVPSAVLESLLEHGGVGAPLAARALAARDDETLRPRILQLLGSADHTLRAHAALGLARSEQKSAVALLDASYRIESSASVRRAIVVALSRRSEPGRKRALELAAAFDPDAAVRHGARLALGAAELAAAAGGGATLWVRVEPPELGLLALVGPGSALPALPDPNGFVVLAGLPQGPLELRLAPAAARGQDSERRSP
jgi:cellulose synthase operon protein C